MLFPPDLVHALFRACAMDSVAVLAMEATCRAWRAAADDVNLWKVCLSGREREPQQPAVP